MKVGPTAELFEMLAELDRLGRADDPSRADGVSEIDRDVWIDPFLEGQVALDELGGAMRRAAAEADDRQRD